MPYARSKKAIQRVEHILRELLTATDDVVYQSLEPAKLAYQLHEGLKSAAVYPEYQAYADLRAKFVIRLKPGRVLLEFRGRPLVALKVVREQLSKMTVPEVADALGIVGAALTHKASEMVFPDAILNDDALATLHRWTSENGYHIINNYDRGVTLTKTHPGELAWEPPSNNGGQSAQS